MSCKKEIKCEACREFFRFFAFLINSVIKKPQMLDIFSLMTLIAFKKSVKNAYMLPYIQMYARLLQTSLYSVTKDLLVHVVISLI